jgi:hypothetical protein
MSIGSEVHWPVESGFWEGLATLVSSGNIGQKWATRGLLSPLRGCAARKLHRSFAAKNVAQDDKTFGITTFAGKYFSAGRLGLARLDVLRWCRIGIRGDRSRARR